MALTTKIVSYDPEWPAQFDIERRRLTPIFGDKLQRVEHVGSTAVPQLAAKPEIDILIEISDDADLDRYSALLLALGYRRGGDLSPGHHFFKRDVGGIRTHKAHLCISGHGQIERLLRFRDLLRNDTAVRMEYQEFKLRLEAENRQGIAEYLAKKAPFIEQLVGEIESE